MKHILTKWPSFMILQLCLTKGNERTLSFCDSTTVLAQLDSMALDRTLLKSVAGQALFSLITDFRSLQIDKTEAALLESIVFNAAGRRNEMISKSLKLMEEVVDFQKMLKSKLWIGG